MPNPKMQRAFSADPSRKLPLSPELQKHGVPWPEKAQARREAGSTSTTHREHPRDGGRVNQLNIPDYDLGIRRYQHTKPLKTKPYAYLFTCFCGEELRLVPINGRKRSCKCGAVARFEGGRASLEREETR